MTYWQCFIQNVHYALFNWKKAFSPLSIEYQFIDKLSENILSIEKGDEVFIKVKAALESPEYLAVENKLKPLRSLLIANMKQYNADKLATIPPVFTPPPAPSPSSLAAGVATKSGVVPKNPGNF